MTVAGVGNHLNLMTDYIVVGLTIDAISVTTFSITQRLITILGSFVIDFGGVSWAGLAQVRATEGKVSFEARTLELVRLSVGLGIAVSATLAAYNAPFVRLWVGREYYGGDLLTILTAAQIAVFSFVVLFAWIIDMQGDTRSRVWVSSVGSLVNLTLSVLLARSLGLYGVTLATVVAYLITDAWYSPYVVCCRYGVGGRAMLATTLRALALGLVWSALIWSAVRRRSEIESWLRLALEFGAANLVTLLYCALVILTPADRAAWGGRLRSYYRRLRAS